MMQRAGAIAGKITTSAEAASRAAADGANLILLQVSAAS